MKGGVLAYVIGASAGSVLAFGIAFGWPGMVGALVLVTAIGLSLPRWSGLAGGLAGIGLVWLVLFLNAGLVCSQPGEPCGATPPAAWPWIFLSLALIGTSLGLVVATRRRGSAPVGGPRV